MKSYWKGRIDGEDQANLRWHQIIKPANEIPNFEQQFVLLGFESDEGVRRNKGRVGAAKAPNAMRQVLSNFPVHNLVNIYDAGNIICEDMHLEKAQQNLSNKIQDIYQKQGKSLVIGGGHEVTYPHFQALRQAFPDAKIGILNFDAHFDNRPIQPQIGASSGTGFYQIAEQEERIHSLHIGIQTHSNTQALFQYAHEKAMQYVMAQDFYTHYSQTQEIVNQFLAKIDHLYITICMDVFASAFAPGVSATAYNGMIPDAKWLAFFQEIIRSPKLTAFDIAELNPSLDIDNRSMKLAASFVFEVMQLNESSQ